MIFGSCHHPPLRSFRIPVLLSQPLQEIIKTGHQRMPASTWRPLGLDDVVEFVSGSRIDRLVRVHKIGDMLESLVIIDPRAVLVPGLVEPPVRVAGGLAGSICSISYHLV